VVDKVLTSLPNWCALIVLVFLQQVETIARRRRYLDLIDSDDRAEKAQAERQVRNLHQISFVMNGTFRNLKVFP
jgi:hypothetical protein